MAWSMLNTLYFIMSNNYISHFILLFLVVVVSGCTANKISHDKNTNRKIETKNYIYVGETYNFLPNGSGEVMQDNGTSYHSRFINRMPNGKTTIILRTSNMFLNFYRNTYKLHDNLKPYRKSDYILNLHSALKRLEGSNDSIMNGALPFREPSGSVKYLVDFNNGIASGDIKATYQGEINITSKGDVHFRGNTPFVDNIEMHGMASVEV